MPPLVTLSEVEESGCQNTSLVVMHLSNMTKILIVEDEEPLARSVEYNLRQEGYQTTVVSDGLAALDSARGNRPDLILLDLMLPQIDGLEVCRLLRCETDVPIIMLTAKSREIDKVVGLEVGADDYVTKPFGMLELLARIRAALRRANQENMRKDEVYGAGPIEMDIERRQVKVGGRLVELRPREFDLLRALISNRGRVLERSWLLDNVWGEDEFIDPGTLDVHVRRLREKIEQNPGKPKLIITARGVGYKFAESPNDDR